MPSPKRALDRIVDALCPNTQISMAAVGQPSQNGYAEWVILTIKEIECLGGCNGGGSQSS